MMLLGLIPVAVSILLALTSGALARRLSPRAGAPLLTLLALATSLATGLVLCLAAFAALARLPFVAAVGGWSPASLDPWDHLPLGGGILAAVVVAALLAGAGAYLAAAARDLLRASRVCRGLGVGPDKLVITRDEHPTAYSVPVRAGAIVISTGMLRLLPAGERRALLAHEAAHLRYHHASYVMLARLAAAANPLLRPLAANVSLAVELWADQAAADEVGDRRVVAQALARASLAAAAPPRGAALTLAMAQTHVSARVQALVDQPPCLYRWALAVALALTLTSSAAALTLTWATHQQIELAQLTTAHARLAAHTADSPVVAAAGLRRAPPAVR
jgi:Zn-dependent protease with chaperone function